MGGASSFYAILAICGFLSATWWASKLSRLVGVSSIVLEITAGVVLGPRVLKLISPEYAECEFQRHTDCQPPSDLYQRLAKGMSVGAHLDSILKMDYCDIHAYVVHSGDLGFGGDRNGNVQTAAGNRTNQTNQINQTSGAPPEGTTALHTTTLALPTTTTALSTTGSAPDLDGADGQVPGGVEANETDDSWANTSSVTTTTIAANGPINVGGFSSSGGGRLLSAGGGEAGASLHYESYADCLEKSCEADVRSHCSATPDIFTLIGRTGVALMIFESGMHFDFSKAKDVGIKACAVAVLGTILPLASGAAVVFAFNKPLLRDGIAAGVALAPTSVGIALRLLGEAGVLQEDFGQAIITAAFVDDILSLILFNVLFNVFFSLGGEPDLFKTVISPVIGIAFMLLAMVAAAWFWPRVLDGLLLPMAPRVRDPEATMCGRMRLTRDELLFFLMMCVLVVYAFITHLLGTHLWGCFIAGMTFACLHPTSHAHYVWVKQTKRLTTWMIRIFFACTVAFSIPVGKLLSVEAFWRGTILGLFPCILTKVICAPCMGSARWVVGWAMVGRAEFAYLIAQMAASANMMDEETFSMVIWALLYATILAPLIFRCVLNRYVRKHGLEDRGVDCHQLSDDEYEEDESRSEAFAREERGRQLKHLDGADEAAAPHADARLRDLEEIRVEAGAAESDPDCKGLMDVSGGDASNQKVIADAVGKSRSPEDAAETYPVVSGKVHPSGKKGRGKSRDRRKRNAGGGNIVFPGASPTTSGFLCCLFFRKVIVD